MHSAKMVGRKSAAHSVESIGASVETITPSEASALLGHNVHNRNLRSSVVERYMRDMLNGGWIVNGEAIIISDEGVLLNGQHRLTACVRADVPFKTLVVRGVIPSAFETIDQNLPRSHADVLSIGGEVCAHQLSAVLVWIWKWERRQMGKMLKPTVNELNGVLVRYPEVRDSIRMTNLPVARRLITPSVLGAFHFIFAMEGQSESEKFFEMLNAGHNLEEGSPLLALRDRALRFSTPKPYPEEIAALVCKAWLAWRAGKKIAVLSWRRGENFPDIWRNVKK